MHRLIAERIAADEQTAAVRGLLWRLLPPNNAAKFRLRVDAADSDASSSGANEEVPNATRKSA